MTEITIYEVATGDAEDHPMVFPTLTQAINEARDIYEYRKAEVAGSSADEVQVDRLTIHGPLNRDLVCRLLEGRGYVSARATIWKAGRRV